MQNVGRYHTSKYGDGYGIRLRTSDYKIFRTRLRSVLEFQELFQPVLFPYFGIQKKSVTVSVPVLYFEIFSVLRTRTRTRTFPVLIPYRFPYSYSVQFLPTQFSLILFCRSAHPFGEKWKVVLHMSRCILQVVCACGKVLHFRQNRYSNFHRVKTILSNPFLSTKI